MKILVTGGCGFIGSNFIRYFLKSYPDYSLINVDKLTYAGNLENLSDLSHSPHYHFIRGDIADGPRIEELIGKGVDEVVIQKTGVEAAFTKLASEYPVTHGFIAVVVAVAMGLLVGLLFKRSGGH
jgi:dTDP-D-glucose 4,6-dehydratase